MLPGPSRHGEYRKFNQGQASWCDSITILIRIKPPWAKATKNMDAYIYIYIYIYVGIDIGIDIMFPFWPNMHVQDSDLGRSNTHGKQHCQKHFHVFHTASVISLWILWALEFINASNGLFWRTSEMTWITICTHIFKNYKFFMISRVCSLIETHHGIIARSFESFANVRRIGRL